MVATSTTTAIPRCRRCRRQHKSWRTMAACRWPRSCWVSGDGRWASVSLCHPGSTIELYDSREKAEEAKRFIDRLACGGTCCRAHVVVDLAGRPGR